jgi:hypothetical protein
MEIDFNLEDSEDQYTLLYEGAVDATPETLRKIKGVFLAELEMPIEQIALILQNTPAEVISSSDASALEYPYRILKDAGSKVLIVSADGTPFNIDSLTEEDTSIVFELEDPLSMEGELDFIEQPKQDLPTYQLIEEPSLSLDSLMEEAAAVIADSRQEEEDQQRTSAGEFKLDIDLSDMPSPTPALDEGSIESAPVLEKSASSLDTGLSLTLEDEEPAERIIDTVQPVASAVVPVSGLVLDAPDAPVTIEPANEQAASDNEFVIAAEPAPIKLESLAITEEKEPAPVATPAPAAAVAEAKAAVKPAAIKTEVKAIMSAKAQKAPVQQENPNTSAEISVVPVHSKRRKKLSQGQETGILIAIGSLVLCLANWFYFNAPPKVDVEAEKLAESRALQIAQKKELLQNKKERAQALAQEQNSLLTAPITFQGSIEAAGYSLNLEVIISNNTPTKASFTISGGAPLALTNEQIARNEKLAPWIRRAESTAFEFKSVSDGSFFGSTASKIYIDYDGRSTRLIENAYLDGIFTPESDKLDLTLSLGNDDKPSEAAPYWLVAAEGNDIKFEFAQKIVLTKSKATPAEPAAEEKNQSTDAEATTLEKTAS